MADRDVEYTVTGKDNTQQSTESVVRNQRRMKRSVQETQSTLDHLASRAEKAFDRIGAAGRRMADSNNSIGKQITGGLVMGGAALGKAGTRIGTDLMNGVGRGIAGAASAVQGHMMAVLVGAAILVSPIVAATLSAGILTAIGAGGIALGIAGIVKSPKIQEILNGKSETVYSGLNKKRKPGEAIPGLGEGTQVKTMDGLIDKAKALYAVFSKPFESPLARALEAISNKLVDLQPMIASWGEKLAPTVDSLATGFIKLVENALPGFNSALEASIPFIEKLAEHGPALGEAIGQAFQYAADAAPYAFRAFEMLLVSIEFILPAVMAIVGGFTVLFSWIDRGSRASMIAFLTLGNTIINVFYTILEGAAKAFSWVPGIGPKLQVALGLFREFAKNANEALANIRDRTVIVRVKADMSQSGGVAGGRIQTPGLRGDPSIWSPAAFAAAFVASGGFSQAQPSRTQPPQTIELESQVTVLLDGAPVDAKIAKAQKRAAWRAQVGRV